MTPGQSAARTYGGWRRTRSIGLLGLGSAGTLTLLGAIAMLAAVAAFSFRVLLYLAPPVILIGSVGVLRVGGSSVAQVAIQRLRWWRGNRKGLTSYRSEVVLGHTGILQLPGTLAATELLSADDNAAAGTDSFATQYRIPDRERVLGPVQVKNPQGSQTPPGAQLRLLMAILALSG